MRAGEGAARARATEKRRQIKVKTSIQQTTPNSPSSTYFISSISEDRKGKTLFHCNSIVPEINIALLRCSRRCTIKSWHLGVDMSGCLTLVSM